MAKKNPIKVTSKNFGNLLIKGLEKAVTVEEDGAQPARVSRRKITARKADVAAQPSTTGSTS